MQNSKIQIDSKEWGDLMTMIYGDDFVLLSDIIERNDFYGNLAEKGFSFLGGKLGLSEEGHVLDLCSGIGGPARFLARKFGCKVTGIDISEVNYKASIKRTKEANLDHLIDFVHGNSLNIPFPDESFTNVIGCESWVYFTDKVQLFKAAYRVLKPKGLISFMEVATEKTKKHGFEDGLGPSNPESIAAYTSKLRTAGFDFIQQYDVTDIAIDETTDMLYKIITDKDKLLLEGISKDAYYVCIEYFTDCLVHHLKGESTHSCFIAQKP